MSVDLTETSYRQGACAESLWGLTIGAALEDPQATAEVIDHAGWLHTGDLARMDRDGYVAIIGRIKDTIIRGGENV